MKRMYRIFTALMLAGACAGTPALGEPGPIAFEKNKPWVHEETGMSFPPMLAGFDLREIKDLTDSQSDVALIYRDDSRKALLSIFYFRAGLPDVSIWQDRVLSTIAKNAGGWGTLGEEPPSRSSFTPVNGVADSGALLTVALDGSQAYATGSAIMSTGEWLVAIRMTSHLFTEKELTDRLLDTIASLPLPASAKSAPIGASYVIEPCPPALPQESAPRSSGDQQEAIMVGTLAIVTESKELSDLFGHEPQSPHYCREQANGDNFSVYSDRVSREDHVIALNDAGVAIMVQYNPLKQRIEVSGNVYTPFMRSAEKTHFYRGFTAKPSIEQIIDAVANESAIASVDRSRTGGSVVKINVQSGSDKQ